MYSLFVLAAVFEPRGWISWIIIRLIAGFLAAKLMRGAGYGIIGDIVVGLVGAFIGGFIVRLIWPNADAGFFGSLIIALIGACLLVWVLHFFSGGRRAT